MKADILAYQSWFGIQGVYRQKRSGSIALSTNTNGQLTVSHSEVMFAL